MARPGPRNVQWTATMVGANSSPTIPTATRTTGKGAGSKGAIMKPTAINLSKATGSTTPPQTDFGGDFPIEDFSNFSEYSINSSDLLSNNSNLISNLDNMDLPVSPVNGTLIKAGAGANLPSFGNIRTTGGVKGTRQNKTINRPLMIADNKLGRSTVAVAKFVVQEYESGMELYRRYLESDMFIDRSSRINGVIKTIIDTGCIDNTEQHTVDVLDAMQLLHSVVNDLWTFGKDHMESEVPFRKLTDLLPNGVLMKGMENEKEKLQELMAQCRVESEKVKNNMKRISDEFPMEEAPKRLRVEDTPSEDMPSEETIAAMYSDGTLDGSDEPKESEAGDVEIVETYKKPTTTFKFNEVAIEDLDSEEESEVFTTHKATRNNMRPGESFVGGPYNKRRENEYVGCGAEPHTCISATKKAVATADKHFRDYGWRKGPGMMGFQTLTKINASDIEKGELVEHPDGGKPVIWKYANTMTDADLRYKLYFMLAMKMHQRYKMPEVVWDTNSAIKSADVEKAAIEYASTNYNLFIKTVVDECKVCFFPSYIFFIII